MDSIKDDYIEWVMSILDKYKKDVEMVHDGEVPPWEIQRLLSSYQTVHFTLIAEYQRYQRSISTTNRLFKAWWNNKISESRKILLSTMPSGKYPALKEYSIKAQEDNEAEYNEWQEKIQEAQDKTDFMKSMLESWTSFLNVLINLNKNMVAELKSLSVDSMKAPK